MRYAVDTEALRADADAVNEALQRLARLGVAQEFGAVAAGLPGGRAAGAAGWLGSAWESRVADTRCMLRSLGGRLLAAAESYDTVERVVGRALDDRAVAGRTGGERAVNARASDARSGDSGDRAGRR